MTGFNPAPCIQPCETRRILAGEYQFIDDDAGALSRERRFVSGRLPRDQFSGSRLQRPLLLAPPLFLAPEAPYPLTGGGALRSASLLQYLARGYEVDLILFRQPGAERSDRPR